MMMIDYILHYLAKYSYVVPLLSSPYENCKQKKNLGTICLFDPLYITLPVNAHRFSNRIIRIIRP